MKADRHAFQWLVCNLKIMEHAGDVSKLCAGNCMTLLATCIVVRTYTLISFNGVEWTLNSI